MTITKNAHCAIVIAVLAVPLLAAELRAACTALDPQATIAHLRHNCGTQANCCTTTGELTTWIGNVRTSPARLFVDIGPGQFDPLRCGAGQGVLYPDFTAVTFRGSGVGQTVLQAPCGLCAGIEVGLGCGDLEFKDLSVVGQKWGILWRADAGDSTWTNVYVEGDGSGWYEFTAAPASVCNPAVRFAKHVWFDSVIEAEEPDGQGGIAYQANCGESHFFNTEFVVDVPEGAPPDMGHEGLAVISVGANPNLDLQRKAVVKLFGSTVRLIAPDWTRKPLDGVVAGVRVYPNGVFEMNDGIVDVRVDAMNPSNVFGVKTEPVFGSLPAGIALTPGAAFSVLRSGSGSAGGTTRRVDGPSTVLLQAPFLHSPGFVLPVADPDNGSPVLLGSMTGADLFVETDCNTAGNCLTAGTQTHLMVSNESCCTAKWFDVSTGRCRGAATPGCQ